MNVIQYEIILPADYDMSIIRKRVADKGHFTDSFASLGIKAYLVSERGVNGAILNRYAPFYIWTDTAEMNKFLVGGGGFNGIIDSFGRPTLQHWAGIAFERGYLMDIFPKAVTRFTELIPVESNPTVFVDQAMERFHKHAKTPGVYCTVLALDPRSWELVCFTLWENADQASNGTRYEVLHLSTPRLADLKTGE